MGDLSSLLETYKLKSRRHRNKALSALEDGDAERARAEFGESIRVMEGALQYLNDIGAPDPRHEESASAGEAEVAEQLADCWGIIGGVYRAEGRLAAAKDAYDKGYEFESSKRFNILNTYNRVNRLVVRILQNPELLSDPPPAVTDIPEQEGRTMASLLGEAAEEIERQLPDRHKDRAWALADLAMVRLLGRQGGVDAALNALGESSKNDSFPYHSMLKVIRELAEVQLPMADKLVEVGESLRGKLPDAMRGQPLESAATN